MRYTDDFVIVSGDKSYLLALLPKIQKFLEEELSLQLHPDKISIRKFGQGIDFLGYIIFPKYRLLRTKTKRRIFKKFKERIVQYQSGQIDQKLLSQSLQSYLGVLSHANTHLLGKELKNYYTRWTGDSNE